MTVGEPSALHTDLSQGRNQSAHRTGDRLAASEAFAGEPRRTPAICRALTLFIGHFVDDLMIDHRANFLIALGNRIQFLLVICKSLSEHLVDLVPFLFVGLVRRHIGIFNL